MSFGHLKEKIIKENLLPYKCQKCGCDGHWQDGIISLQLHHKDGNHQNDDLSNLEFLCPNCHSLTDSWCKSHRADTFNKTLFLEKIKEGKSIRQALLSMGLSDGSANYRIAYQVLEEEKLDYQSYTALLRGNKELNNHCLICGCLISSGARYCKDCYDTIQRRTERPDPETLLKEIATSSFVKVGAKYGVSDKAIVKWCVAYGLPTKKKDLVELYKQQHSPDSSIGTEH